MIEFADPLQDVLQPVKVLPVASHLGDLFFLQAEVANHAFGVADRKHPDGVSLATSALGAALTMSNRALEQRTPQDGGEVRETAQEPIGSLRYLGMFHY
ncbi:MAG TPA: hypothetical protein VGD41_11255 [Pyrinomonadaceae bacterium]